MSESLQSEKKSWNKNLTNAKKAKNDEFYTLYHDIEKEVNAYIEYNPDVFRGKIIFLPCDDPEWSNFTRFFAQNFERFGLEKLISTSYAQNSKECKDTLQSSLLEVNSPKYDKTKTDSKGKIYTLTRDLSWDGKVNVDDLDWNYLEGDGDFRSEEVRKLRDEADIIITNPPFSLFREFIAWVTDINKQFLIISNLNAITYKEIFPLIKGNKIWLGISVGGKTYIKPDKSEQKMGNTCWFTNLDHGRRHKKLSLMTQSDITKFVTKKPFEKYDNYDAIEISLVKNIPSDYDGVMGVPISFLDKYSPEQFDIVGTSDNGLVDDELKKTPGLTKEFVDDYYKSGGTGAYKEGNPTAGYYENSIAKMIYKRIFIKHKK